MKGLNSSGEFTLFQIPRSSRNNQLKRASKVPLPPHSFPVHAEAERYESLEDSRWPELEVEGHGGGGVSAPPVGAEGAKTSCRD